MIVAQAGFESQFRRLQRGKHHALVDDVFGFLAKVVVGVLLHFLHDQFLVERSAIDANAHGLAVVASDFADGGKLLVPALAGAHVSGIDAIFVQRSRAFRIFRQQHVAVVVKIADDGRNAAGVQQTFLDFRHRGSRFRHVYGPANDFGAGLGQLDGLAKSGFHVGSICIRHGLHDYRRAAANADASDLHGIRFAPGMPGGAGLKAFDLREHYL